MKISLKSVSSSLRFTLGLALLACAALTSGITFSEGTGKAAAGTPLPSGAQVRTLRVPSISAAPGSLLSVPVELFANGNEQTIRFSLKFDSSALVFEGAETGVSADGARLIVEDGNALSGSIGISVELPSERHFDVGTNQVVNLKFRLSESRVGHFSKLELSDSPVQRSVSDSGANPLDTAFNSGTVSILAAIESDLAPRPNGSDDGALTIGDWVQAGRFASKLDTAGQGSEFQRADSAPRSTFGDGLIRLADWVQAGRYVEALDPSTPAAGPTAPSASNDAGSVPADIEQGLVVRVANTTFTRGQDNNLSIEMDAQGNENAAAFTLNFNPDHLIFVSATLGSGVPANAGAVLNTNAVQAAAGRVGFALALRGGFNFGTGTKQILSVRFSVPTSGNQNTSNVNLTDEVLLREVVGTNAVNLTGTFSNGTVTFTPTVNEVPIISTIAPSFVTVGGPAFTLIVIGSNFVNGATVRIDGQDLATAFVAANELQAFVPASLIAQPAVLGVSVRNPSPGGGISATLQLQVNNPGPVITELSPNIVGVNTGSFTIRVRGSNFVSGATVRFNGEDRQTNFVSSTELTAIIPGSDITTISTAQISVRNPEPGGGISNQLPLLIVTPNGLPRLISLEPETKVPGDTAFTLVVNGSNFGINAIVRWQGSPRPTHFVSSTQLTADISAADIASPGVFTVSVVNPPPGGGNSNGLPFRVEGNPNPAPTLTSISPTQVTSGGPDFTLIATGTNFTQTTVVQFNGQSRQTQFISATEVRGTIFATDIATGGTAQITVSNPAPGGGVSQPQTLTINFGAPVITLLSPSAALAGGPAFTLTVIGTSFSNGSVVRWNGGDRQTEFVSGTELRASISAADIAAIGTAAVTVFSPSPGGGQSNSVNFTIRADNNPLPRIDSINPTQGFVNGSGLTITVVGTGFVQGSVVRVDGSARATQFVDATHLTAAILASDLTTIRTLPITVFNSTPGGGTSNAVNFAVVAQPPTAPHIDLITPNTVNAGGQPFALAVEGTNFNESSVVQFNNSDRSTQFVNTTQLIAQITQEDIRFGGVATITVINAPNGGSSNAVGLTILNATPTITGTVPVRLDRGSSQTTVLVQGTNFASNMAILVNGSQRQTDVISPTSANVLILGSDRSQTGTLNLVARNPEPGGGNSNTFPLQVVEPNPLPRIESISPDSANAGGPGFSLVVTGVRFVQGSIVRFGNRDLQTQFISDTSLVATVNPEDLLLGGQVPVRVINPPPGGGNSGAIFFNITTLPPTLTSVTPNPIVGGPGAVQATIAGTNFAGASSVLFNGVAKSTTFVSTTQLTLTLQPADLFGVTSATIQVVTPPPGGGASNILTVGVVPPTAPVPVITSLDPGGAVVGSPAVTLRVLGSQFFPSSVIQVGGVARTTQFVNQGELQTTIAASEMTAVTSLQISVFTPGPGGGTSNAVGFSVVSGPPPAPTLTSLQPGVGVLGTPFILTTNGTNFQTSSVIQVNGQNRATNYISGTQLTTQLTAGDVASTGNLTINVFTPAPGGGVSNPLTLQIVNQDFPVPVITSLDPGSVVAGGPGFVMKVFGDGFRSGSVVRINGQDHPTTIVSTVELNVQVVAADIFIPGVIPVNVFNPAPGGGLSNTLNLIVNASAPAASCKPICWSSAGYWERNPGKWPGGLIYVGGVNGNSPIPVIGNVTTINDALHGGSSPLQQLNQQYVAWQFNFGRAQSSANAAKESTPQNAYNLTFAAVTLSNGVTISPNSPLGLIESETRAALSNNRTVDYVPLANLMLMFNGTALRDACFIPGPGTNSCSGAVSQTFEIPAILRREDE